MLHANDADERGLGLYGGTDFPRLVHIGEDGRIVRVWTGYGEDELPEPADEVNRALAVGRDALTESPAPLQ